MLWNPSNYVMSVLVRIVVNLLLSQHTFRRVKPIATMPTLFAKTVVRKTLLGILTITTHLTKNPNVVVNKVM